MKDWSISKKIDGKYVTLCGVKEGWKFSITPTGKKELLAWLKNGQDDYFSGNFKVWEDKPAAEPTQHDQAKQNAYQPADNVTDEQIPF